MSATASSPFKPATRQKLRLRMAIDGPPGAGKTFTALRAATTLAGENGRIAVINTESGAICKYLGLAPDGVPWEFDLVEPDNYSPSTYTELILAAGRAGYDVLIVDSLSHAWEGEGGALDQVDRKTGDNGNKFTAWKDVTPQHRRMVEAILRSPCHVITTMRTKTDYVLEPNEKGKMQPKKVGLKAVQREGMEYEFDVVVDMDVEHVMTVSKTRCPDIDRLTVCKPSALTFEPLVTWLEDGSDVGADHYARTEADLRIEQKAIAASKTPEERRREAAEKQRAAKSGANGGGGNAKKKSDSTSPGSDAADPNATPATSDQLDRIEELAEKNCESLEQLMEMVSRRMPGAERLSHLSTMAAQLLIGDLLGMGSPAQEEQSAAEVAAAVEYWHQQDTNADSVNSTNGPHPAPDGLNENPSTITPAQRAELKRLAEKSGWPVDGEDGQAAWLKHRGLANFRGLSQSAAWDLISQLRVMVGEIAGSQSVEGSPGVPDEIPF